MNIITLLIYFLIVGFTAIQSASTKLFGKSNGNSAVFNMIKTLSAFLLFLAIGLGGIEFHKATLIYGCIYGILLSLSMHCGYMALSLGAMSLTSMIVSFSVLIPTAYGILFLNESLNTLKILGMVFFVASIILANANKPKGTVEKAFKWAMYVAATFVCNGFGSVVQKLHQIKFESYCAEFTFFAMFVCCVVFWIAGFKWQPIKKFVSLKEGTYAVISGITNAMVAYLTTKLAGFSEASTLFPAISAGTILCSLLFGMTVFKEKLLFNHFVAIFFGIVAVVLLKL